ncbi:MAG: dihydroorotase [Winogradskyella sp.]|uniref:dihydroorotase n=1 Tax=Winogradskyella sp. TaxID=1883156 RepID=UPI000F3BF4AF|nr:dihydroorotase [Winogradskyella sp.]RNC83475.1 MAG: dihydroorotase [Winogradskyella sp.]
MRTKFLATLFFIVFTCISFSQNTTAKVGDMFTIGETESGQYESIDLPKPNVIIKKGGIANYDNLAGNKVEVVSIKENKEGRTIATIKMANKRFFNSHKFLKVDIAKALETKELLPI